MSALDFDDLAPIEERVSIGGKKYILREATGDAGCKYRNSLLKATKLGPDGKPVSIEGMADSEPLLVSLCLFELYEQKGSNGVSETKERPTPLIVVRSWPARVQKALFERAKEISDLDEKETLPVLQKRLADTQKKIMDISTAASAESARGNGDGEGEDYDPTKNSPGAMTAGSV